MYYASLVSKVLSEINMSNCGSLPDFGNFCIRDGSGEHWGDNCIEEFDVYKKQNYCCLLRKE